MKVEKIAHSVSQQYSSLMPDASVPTTINLRPPLWLPIIVIVIGGLFYLVGKNMEIRAQSEFPTVISVSADAKISAAADIATLSFGVATGRQSSAKAAIALVTKNMTAIIAAVKKAGVEDKDIATQSFRLNPTYDYTNGTQVPRGFEANQTLNVKVRDLDKVGDVLSSATNAGANQVDNIVFSIDNSDDLKAQVRSAAIEKAKAKAEVLARSLRMRLGRIREFSEDGNSMPRPMMIEGKSMAYDGIGGADASLPVPSGEQEIISYVKLTYELR